MFQTRTAVPAHGEDAEYLPLLSPIHSQLSNEYTPEQFKDEVLAKLSGRTRWDHEGDYIDFSLNTPRFMCGCPKHRNRRVLYGDPIPTSPHYRLDSTTLELRHRDKNCQGAVILRFSIEELPPKLRICMLR